MGNVDRGDYFKKVWITEDSVDGLHVSKFLKRNGG